MTAADGDTAPQPLSEQESVQKERLLAAGHEAFDADDCTRALDCYHRASLLDGADPAVWTALGMTYANLDLVREAWRSYKLGLLADPENLDTLWYAAEFLFNAEDFTIARLLLERYLSIEVDAQRRLEAEELLGEVVRVIGDDDQIRDRPRYTGSDDPEELPGDGDELEGFSLDDEGEEDDADIEDDYADDDLAHDDDVFVASLHLELKGLDGKCPQCDAAIPSDAPSCYRCHAPHIYKDE